MVSALIGQPPNNELDYIIVKGIFRRLGIKGHDPSEGAHIPPFRPANYQHETRAPGIIAANCVCIVLALLFTGSRVLIRALYRGLRWGWDDWFIILGTVSVVHVATSGGCLLTRDQYFSCAPLHGSPWGSRWLCMAAEGNIYMM